MAIVTNDTERLPICKGCPYLWGKTVCDQMTTDGTGQYAEKKLRVFCVHIDSCQRAFRRGMIYEYETDTDEPVR